MQVVILCGGSGTRLWPISRALYPKQFVKLFNNESLYQKTISRNAKLADSFAVVINQEQYFMGLDQLDEMKLNTKNSYILEPIGRNTAPAIAMAALATHPEEILLVVPSDHLIEKQSDYEMAVSKAVELAKTDRLVTFGIKPGYAETGYGYIETNGINVQSFKEKLLSEKGGVDLQLLGIGRNGHVGFNEPGSLKNSRTRVVKLTEETIAANRDQFVDEMIPSEALSMGIETILEAKSLVMLATGKSKAETIKYLLNHHDDPDCPATYLKSHSHFTLVLDPEAASRINLKI